MQEILTDDIPLKDRLLKNWFWMYFLSFVIAPTGYLIKLMVSRELSVEDIGLVYSIIGFIGLLSAFNDLGLTEALQYYLPQYMIDKEFGKAKTILVITRIVQFLWWIVIWGILYAIAPWMAAHYFHSQQAITILRYFCIYFLFINLFQVLQSVFTALQNVKLQYACEAIRMRCVTIFVGCLVFFDTITLYNFSQIRLIWVIIGVFIAWLFFWKEYAPIFRKATVNVDKDVLKTQRSYAWKIMIGMQIGTIYSQIGQQFAISFLWPYDAGIWTNYMTFFTGISVFTGPIIAYLFPLFTELYKKNEQTKIKLVQKYLIRWVIIASVGIAIGWWYFSERAAVTFLTEEFRMSGILFKWTSLGMFFVIATWVQFALLAGAWLVQERVRIIIYGTIGWLLMSYLWVQIWWLWWLVASLLITHIYFWGHSLFYLKRFNHYEYF